MGSYERVRHEFPPVYNENSRILILGSLPSVKSREQMFYYGHPQNRFWKVIAGLTGASVPSTIPEKKALLLAQGIAVSDVIAECDIIGSSDSSIRNVIPMDLQEILENARIRRIYANCQRDIIGLPSTSPANAAYSLDRLIEAWTCIL